MITVQRIQKFQPVLCIEYLAYFCELLLAMPKVQHACTGYCESMIAKWKTNEVNKYCLNKQQSYF